MILGRLLKFGFSNKLALISGAPKYDHEVSTIARTLKRVAGDSPVSIVGAVSDEYAESFSNIYASSSLLDNYEFEVTRAYNSYHEDIQDCRVMPYRIYTHYKNHQFIKELERKNFFQNVFENGIEAVATVGNFSLALRIGEKLNEYSSKLNKPKPFTALFHRQHSERTIQNEEFLDYQYYYVEKTPTNSSGYVFPSYCVGYEGLYAVYRHLQQFRRDPEDDLFNFENFTWEISELVKKSRTKYRADHGISEDKYIFFIDAGENTDKIDFTFKKVKDGFNVFFAKDQISGIDKNHFEIFVALPSKEKLANAIRGKLGYLPNGVKVTLIEEKDRQGALCASDFGLLHNGQATVEAAAAQLPSLVIDNMTNFHAYFNNLYNGHASPLNIATNYEGYQDLTGSLTAIGQKIGTSILRHFQTPKLRYYYAKLYSDQLQKIISKSGTNPQLRIGNSGLDLGCRHLLRQTDKYNKLQDSLSKPSYKRVEARKSVFSEI